MKSLSYSVIVFVLFLSAIAQRPGGGGGRSCTNNCSGQGSCYSGQCYCYDGRFDSTCSSSADKLEIGELVDKDISAESWGYFYYPLEGNKPKLIKIFIIYRSYWEYSNLG